MVVDVVDGWPYRLSSSIDHHLSALAVRTTLMYLAFWAANVTVSGVLEPVQLATVAQRAAVGGNFDVITPGVVGGRIGHVHLQPVQRWR